MLIAIKDRNYEIIQKLETEFVKVLKLKNEKFLLLTGKKLGNIFIYKDKKLVFEKQIKLTSINAKSLLFDNLAKSENEIMIISGRNDFFLGFRKGIIFIDIEKDKKIKSFEYDFFRPFSFDSINDRLLAFCIEHKLFQIDLITHSKKNEFFVKPFDSEIYSLLCLNEKACIVALSDYINQYEFDKDYKFVFKNKIEFKTKYIRKYPKNRLYKELNY